MINKIEDFLLNKFAGKLIARGAVLAAAWIVGQAAKGHISLDPAEVSGLLMLGASSAFEWLKARRMKNPNSPAVQTDKSVEASPVPLP